MTVLAKTSNNLTDLPTESLNQVTTWFPAGNQTPVSRMTGGDIER
jgi:hypothetical protein